MQRHAESYAMSQHERRKIEQPILEEMDEDDTALSEDPDWWKENINYPDEMLQLVLEMCI